MVLTVVLNREVDKRAWMQCLETRLDVLRRRLSGVSLFARKNEVGLSGAVH